MSVTAASYTITISVTNGFSRDVTLSIQSGLPTDAVAVFDPEVITGGAGTSTLTITPDLTTPTGDFTLVIAATDGELTKTVEVPITVTVCAGDGGDFSLSVERILGPDIDSGGGLFQIYYNTYRVTLTRTGGFIDDVVVDLSDIVSVLGADAVYQFDDAAFDVFDNASYTFTGATTEVFLAIYPGCGFVESSFPSDGLHTLGLTGTSGATSHSASFDFGVPFLAISDGLYAGRGWGECVDLDSSIPETDCGGGDCVSINTVWNTLLDHFYVRFRLGSLLYDGIVEAIPTDPCGPWGPYLGRTKFEYVVVSTPVGGALTITPDPTIPTEFSLCHDTEFLLTRNATKGSYLFKVRITSLENGDTVTSGTYAVKFI